MFFTMVCKHGINSQDTWCIKSQRILFDVQKQGTKFVPRKILGNIDVESKYDIYLLYLIRLG